MPAEPPRNARSRLQFAFRGLRNGVIDLRYGPPLSGRKVSPYRHLGSADVANSDYGALRQIFADRVRPDDVLVDVGCGKGRVLNFWLRHYPRHRLIGLERDASVGLATGHRLRRYPDCEVVVSDASVWLPDDGTLFFLYNPFDRSCMQEFLDRLNERADDSTLVLYSNPRHRDVFDEDHRWSVELVSLRSKGAARYDDLAVISRVVDTPDRCVSRVTRPGVRALEGDRPLGSEPMSFGRLMRSTAVRRSVLALAIGGATWQVWPAVAG